MTQDVAKKNLNESARNLWLVMGKADGREYVEVRTQDVIKVLGFCLAKMFLDDILDVDCLKL